jgi:hypothetical protein
MAGCSTLLYHRCSSPGFQLDLVGPGWTWTSFTPSITLSRHFVVMSQATPIGHAEEAQEHTFFNGVMQRCSAGCQFPH